MQIISTDQEKYHFLNMCNLCRYARFSQAQSHIVPAVEAKLAYNYNCSVYLMTV